MSSLGCKTAQLGWWCHLFSFHLVPSSCNLTFIAFCTAA